MSYLFVQNPKNGKSVSIFTKAGQTILQNYVKQVGGATLKEKRRLASRNLLVNKASPAHKKTAPKKTAPKKTAPKKTNPAPKKTAPKKASTAPKKTGPRMAKFYDISKDICPTFEDYDNCTDSTRRSLDDIAKQKGILPGDIVFLGDPYEGRQEYGIYFYGAYQSSDFFYVAESQQEIKEYGESRFSKPINLDKAIKELVEWAKEFGLDSQWVTTPPPAPKKSSTAPKKASPAHKKASPAHKKASPAPKKASPAPKKASPAPKKASPVAKKAERGCVEATKANGFSNSEVAKYQKRKSPPYPANNCPEGTVMEGNDGEDYIAKANKNGVNAWRKV